jgi:hypothetical protein
VSANLPFVIPSEAEGSAVQRTPRQARLAVDPRGAQDCVLCYFQPELSKLAFSIGRLDSKLKSNELPTVSQSVPKGRLRVAQDVSPG